MKSILINKYSCISSLLIITILLLSRRAIYLVDGSLHTLAAGRAFVAVHALGAPDPGRRTKVRLP